MANQEAVIEKPTVVEGKKPYESLFEKDHPELVIKIEKSNDSKRSAFEENLDKAVKNPEVREEHKEETKEAKQPAESETKPQADKVEEPVKEEAQPAEAEEVKGKVITADDDIIKSYAERNSISEEEAKEEIEANRSILKKYKDDPIELAKAYRNLQSTYDKQKVSETHNQQARMVSDIMADPNAFVAKAERENAPKWVEEYRKTYPAKSEMMTDAVIIEECRQVALNQVKGQISEYQIKLKSESNERRQELIKSIPEADRPFATEIGKVLAKLPDVQVIDKGFNFEDLVRWARGSDGSIKKLIKDAEERGYKMAQEGKILGEKFIAKTPSSLKPKAKENVSHGGQLSSFEQRRAREMFSSAYDNDEERYEAYIDVYKSRKK